MLPLGSGPFLPTLNLPGSILRYSSLLITLNRPQNYAISVFYSASNQSTEQFGIVL